MNHLLRSSGLAALRRFAAPDTLVALDYDGTLAAIRDKPSEARLSRAMTRQLQQLREVLPTVIITGRASAELRPLLSEVQDIEIVGNHGAENSTLMPPGIQARIAGWREMLDEEVGGMEGVVVEDKGYSLSVHYRSSPDWVTARDAILRAAESLADAKIIGGKAVVNVVLPEAPDKGTAVLLACRRARCRRAIYAGDDETDEHVFALNRPDEILTVHIGPGRKTRADYYLTDPGEVREMLELLTRLAKGERI